MMKTVLRHTILLFTGTALMVPVVWMISLSFKSSAEMFLPEIHLWPQTWNAAENYGAAFTKSPLPKFLLNGVLVCGAILALQIAVALPFAYALAKLRFKGREVLFSFVVAGLMIPPQVLAIPLFVLFYQLKLLDTFAALILPWGASMFCIFLLRQFFRAVPTEIIDAARLDGMSELGIVLRIMTPAALPAIGAFAIFSVVSHWNDLFWPLIMVKSESLAMPPLGLVFFRSGESGTNYGPLMAASVIVAAPLVVTFVFAQKYFIEGMTLINRR
jgi:multiple sugar transport system permease protein